MTAPLTDEARAREIVTACGWTLIKNGITSGLADKIAQALAAVRAEATAKERERAALIVETLDLKDEKGYFCDETAQFAVAESREEIARAIRETPKPS